MDSMGMETFMDGELESLCSMLTFDEPEIGTQFLGNSSATSLVTSSNDDGCSQRLNFSTSYEPLHIAHHENIDFNHLNHIDFPHEYESFLSINYSSMLETEDKASFLPAYPWSNMISESTPPNNERSSSCLSGDTEDSETANLGSRFDIEPQLKRKHDAQEMEAHAGTYEKSKKKFQVLKPSSKKTAQLPVQKDGHNEQEKITNKESSTECTTAYKNSDNEASNASQETSTEGENSTSKELLCMTSKGKKRASRGAATDPQSLYARRRRQRINERLRILQNLVPNGNKVDISTMLEEALHYVKFMQLQIRLLSSDELWMYAPIAYMQWC